jgi:hypothetical protein
MLKRTNEITDLTSSMSSELENQDVIHSAKRSKVDDRGGDGDGHDDGGVASECKPESPPKNVEAPPLSNSDFKSESSQSDWVDEDVDKGDSDDEDEEEDDEEEEEEEEEDEDEEGEEEDSDSDCDSDSEEDEDDEEDEEEDSDSDSGSDSDSESESDSENEEDFVREDPPKTRGQTACPSLFYYLPHVSKEVKSVKISQVHDMPVDEVQRVIRRAEGWDRDTHLTLAVVATQDRNLFHDKKPTVITKKTQAISNIHKPAYVVRVVVH